MSEPHDPPPPDGGEPARDRPAEDTPEPTAADAQPPSVDEASIAPAAPSVDDTPTEPIATEPIASEPIAATDDPVDETAPEPIARPDQPDDEAAAEPIAAPVDVAAAADEAGTEPSLTVAEARDQADAAVADAAEAAEAAADAREAAEVAAAAAAAVAGVEHEAVTGPDGPEPSDESAPAESPTTDSDEVFDAAAAAADAAAAATAAAAAAEAAADRVIAAAERDPDEAAAAAAEALAAAAAAKEAAALAVAAAEAATRAASTSSATVAGSTLTPPGTESVAAEGAAGGTAVVIAGAAATDVPKPRRANRLRRAVGAFVGTIAALLIGLATAIVIVAVAIALLFNPIWVGIGQQHAESGLKTGYGPDDLRAVTGSILSDLVFGPPDFAVQVLGQPVLNEAERGHMRDVRTVFIGFGALALGAVIVLILARLISRGSIPFWKRVRRGAKATAIVTVALGLTGIVAFDTAFEVFHELLFPGGGFTFDPARDRLVQLFPEQFWLESTLVLAAAIVVLSYLVTRFAGRRIPEPVKTPKVASSQTVAPGRPAG